MLSYTTILILGGCALGTIQLVAGVALGYWLRRPDGAEANRDRRDMAHAGEIAKRLQVLADEMSCNVGEHRNRLDQATQLLRASENSNDQRLAELVVDVIGDIVRANQQLKSQLETAEHRLEEQAVEIEAHISRSLTDPLTGLPNRREFNDRLEERMAAWQRRKECFSLLLLDLDRFKELNDELGHLVGDQALATVARVVRCAVRREDAVARYGGEEFAILLPNTTLEQATHVAHKVHDAVRSTIIDHNQCQFGVTLSGGLSMIGPGERSESLIQRADTALYMAKSNGRDCTFVHDGTTCVLTADYLRDGDQSTKTFAPAVDEFQTPEVALPTVDESNGEAELTVGAYLPREAISAELAQTCEELRRYVDERGQRPQESPLPAQSH